MLRWKSILGCSAFWRVQACLQAGPVGKTEQVAVKGGSHLGILSKDEIMLALGKVLELEGADALLQGARSSVRRICATRPARLWRSSLSVLGEAPSSGTAGATAHCT